MTLPLEAQVLVDQLRALLHVPACELRISMDDQGQVQAIQPLLTYRRVKALTNGRVVRKLDRVS